MTNKSPIVLIALASSTTLAQQASGPGDGNIPAPNLFDSQIVCSSNLPSMRPTPTQIAEDAMASALDTAIGMGNLRITDQDLLDDLGYVIPSAGSNCGQGTDADAFMAATQGAVATDIAEGYSALLPTFMAVYGDPNNVGATGTAGALERAREALERAEADDTTSAARLTVLRNAVTRAQEADTEARAGFNVVAKGPIGDAAVNPIYSAALAEWMAKSAVTQAIADYNTAVTSANTAQNTVDALSYGSYAPLGNDALVDDVVVNSTVNLARLREYVNIQGNSVASADSDGVYDTSDSNFDTTGNLVAPNQLVDGELEAVTQATQVQNARTAREDRRIALLALKTLQTDNKNLLLQPVIDEGVRRAQAEFDYYDQQLRNALADNTNLNPVTTDNPNTPQNEAAPYSIASRHSEYITASNSRVTAEATLKRTAAEREAATQNVVDQFGNPGSFYQQLIARREALKAAADQAVADAQTPSMQLTDAATAAAEALTDAQNAQATYEAIVGDPEGPIDDLVATLLEADGDDGQALVDALSQTYARTAENGEAIEALTADTDDGAEEDGPITANAKRIDSLDGRVTQNEEDIETLQGETEMMSGMISSNAENIATNAGNIVTNAGFISQNATHIATNSGRIDLNASHIALNSERIGANAAAIGMNSTMIGDNRERIGELSGQLEAVRAGVAASIALSRMPSVDGGLSFGAGVYGGETAFAVGFALERRRTSLDFGVTTSAGEIGAGIGVGVKLWGR